jgi:hypothetical protein
MTDSRATGNKYQDAYYWILSEEGFLRLTWIENDLAFYVEEEEEPVDVIDILSGPMHEPTQEDIARWQADPAMRERHLHAMEMKELGRWQWDEGYYWICPRNHHPMIALCRESWIPVRYGSREIPEGLSDLHDLRGLVLYGPLEAPELPEDVASRRFVPNFRTAE